MCRRSRGLLLVVLLAVMGTAAQARAGGVPSPLFFDVLAERTDGPPFPSQPPLQLGVFPSPGDTVPTEVMEMQLHSASEPLVLSGLASFSGGPQGTPGETTFFDVFVGSPEVGAGQPLSFSDLSYTGLNAFLISLDLGASGPVSAQAPLFRITMTGEAAPAPEPGSALLVAGAVGALFALRRRLSP